MPLDDLHRDVASTALSVASEHGFALGGGNALRAHGIISRPTMDVDLFSNREHAITEASPAVEAALAAAGYRTEQQDKTAGIEDMFYDDGDIGLAEWTVTAQDGRQLQMQMAYFDRSRDPVIVEDVGPVLHVEDAIGGKVAALASRAYERDYSDVGQALGRYTADELIGFARRVDPGLTDADFADAGQRLDRLPDRRLTEVGLTPEDVATVRERFASWPRDAPERDTGSATPPPGAPGRDDPGPWPSGSRSADREAE
jgi:hypothetical protein